MRYNKNEWKPWIEFIEKGADCVEDAVLDTKPKYLLLVASAFSVSKWLLFVRSPEMFEHDSCGLCFYNNSFETYNCSSCPLDKMGKNCNLPESIYANCLHSERGGKEEIKAFKVMLSALLKIYEAEYKKVVG